MQKVGWMQNALAKFDRFLRQLGGYSLIRHSFDNVPLPVMTACCQSKWQLVVNQEDQFVCKLNKIIFKDFLC